MWLSMMFVWQGPLIETSHIVHNVYQVKLSTSGWSHPKVAISSPTMLDLHDSLPRPFWRK